MSNKYEAQGQIIAIDQTITFDSGFQKREFVIEIPDGKYPQQIKFEILKDGVDSLDKFHTGDEVKVHFNLRGREWKGRYFVNLVAWRIENIGGGSGDPKPEDFDPDKQTPEGDEIPF